MKVLRFLFLLTLATYSSVLQAEDTLKHVKTKNETVSFVATIDIKRATVDGIYLNGYVVNIHYDRLVELNGKKVLISGKVTIIKGLKNKPPTKPLSSGRYNDTKHILNPKVTILKS
jgi:hypothetical protein